MKLLSNKKSAVLAAVIALSTFVATTASAQWVSGAGTQTTSNNVGIGTTPGVPLEIQKAGINLSGGFYFNMITGDGTRGFLLGYDTTGGSAPIGVIAPRGVSGQLSFWNHNGSAWGERMRIDNLGNVGIGTTAATAKLDVNGNANISGNLTVVGNIAAKYQDVAEWVPSSKDIPPGSVVILDESQTNHVLPSATAYDQRVAGVISAQPGLILGEAGENKVQVATTGRVKVRVDARFGAVKVGDLLVTSDREGVAMVSQPIKVGGASMHRPGTILGKALEPLASGTGEILVLLTLQ